mmetsp:Transcript_13322/g.19444  ORF Transcript_13322/g.19444 Transcript_13322/m.19444 type:complete len:224 (+) Transcript_13322:19-690(+)
MGNDGGSIAKRSEVVLQKKPKKKTHRSAMRSSAGKLCFLTQEPLKSPVVCKLGNLYNKEALVEALFNKTLPKAFRHIASPKDFKQINSKQNEEGRLVCPVSNIEMNGVHKFFVMWDCGCLVSEKARNQMPSERCLVCDSEITQVVSLDMTASEKKQLKKTLLKNRKAKKNSSSVPQKKPKLIDTLSIEQKHQDNLSDKVYKSLFEGETTEETFLCRNLRYGLR